MPNGPERITLLSACPEVNAPSQKVLRIPASRHQMAYKQLPVFQHLFRSKSSHYCEAAAALSAKWPGCPGIFLITDFPVMQCMIFISPRHMGHSSGSTSHIFLMHSRQVGDGMRRAGVLYLETSRTSISSLVSSCRCSSFFSISAFRRSPRIRFELQP